MNLFTLTTETDCQGFCFSGDSENDFKKLYSYFRLKKIIIIFIVLFIEQM